MATWAELKTFIHATYTSDEISPRAIRMLFDMGAGRSQLVFVTSVTAPDGSEWASIDSPVGKLGELNVNACLIAVAGLVCGGLAHVKLGDDDLLLLRHAFPLGNLDANEFQEPLAHITTSADAFERFLTDGGDAF